MSIDDDYFDVIQAFEESEEFKGTVDENTLNDFKANIFVYDNLYHEIQNDVIVYRGIANNEDIEIPPVSKDFVLCEYMTNAYEKMSTALSGNEKGEYALKCLNKLFDFHRRTAVEFKKAEATIATVKAKLNKVEPDEKLRKKAMIALGKLTEGYDIPDEQLKDVVDYMQDLENKLN